MDVKWIEDDGVKLLFLGSFTARDLTHPDRGIDARDSDVQLWSTSFSLFTILELGLAIVKIS